MKIIKIAKLKDFIKDIDIDSIAERILNFIIDLEPSEKRKFFTTGHKILMFGENIKGENIHFILKDIKYTAEMRAYNDFVFIVINPKFFFSALDPAKRNKYKTLLKSSLAHELFHVFDPKTYMDLNYMSPEHGTRYLIHPQEFDAYSIEIITLLEEMMKDDVINKSDILNMLRNDDWNKLKEYIMENPEISGVFGGSSDSINSFLNKIKKHEDKNILFKKRIYKEVI